MRYRSWRIAVCLTLLPCLGACSLFTVSFPDKPLSQRDLNARMQTREYAANFAVQVEVTADDIAHSADSAIQLDALRWKLGASKASQHAATQMAPMMALLDTWALSAQMQQFFSTGAGTKVFGSEQSKARAVADKLADDAQKLVRGLTSADEFTRYQDFVVRYTHEQPLTDLNFARTSIIDRWAAETNQQASIIETIGTISQSMNDVSDRMRMLGERAPSQAVWETQLAFGESDFGRADFGHAFAQANESLDRLSRLAESSPEQVRAGIADLRTSLFAISDRFDTSWVRMMQTVEQQRVALAANVRDEREAAVLAIDTQRAALAKDAERITDQAITAGGVQVRGLVREVLLYGALLYIVLLGLPFAAGYFLGHTRGAKAKTIV